MTVRIFSAAVFLIAAAFTIAGSSYRISFGDPLGPAAFPVLIGIPALCLSAALITFPGDSYAWGGRAAMMKLAAGIVSLLAFALCLETVGFIPSTSAVFAVLAGLFGASARNAIFAAALASPGLFLLFDVVLGLPLPAFGNLIG